MDIENLEEFMSKVLTEGEPFEIFITLNSTNLTTFNLDTSNWDWNGDGVAEVTPFGLPNLKMFIITGLGLEATVGATGTTFDYLTIDGIECTPLDWYRTAFPTSVTIKWDGMPKAGPLGGHTAFFAWPKITDHYSVPLVCRSTIAAKLFSRVAPTTVVVRVRGYAIDRQY
jgi:hypothetical protein